MIDINLDNLIKSFLDTWYPLLPLLLLELFFITIAIVKSKVFNKNK